MAGGSRNSVTKTGTVYICTRARKQNHMHPLTEDAVHNWGTAYIEKRYHDVSDEIRQAVHAAMVRHHQQGTSAREEAQALNARFGLTKEA